MRILAKAPLALVLALVAVAGCKKDTRASAQPGASEPGTPTKAAPAPTWIDSAHSDVLGVAFLSDGTGLRELERVLSAIDPRVSQGMPMMREGLAQGLESELGKLGLSVDTTRPLRLLVLDPKRHPQPLVVIGTIAGTPKDPASLVPVRAAKAAGAPSAIAAVKDLLPRLPAATELRIVVFPQNLLRAFGAELDAMASMASSMGGPQGASLGPLMKMYTRGLGALADSTRFAEILFESEGKRGSVLMRLHARPNTLLARTIAVQRANDFSYVRRLPMVGRSMIMDSNVVAGPAKKAMVDFTIQFMQEFAKMSGEQQGVYAAEVANLAELLTGRFAGTMSMKMNGTALPKMESTFAMGLERAGDAQASIDRLMSSFAKGGGVGLPGVKQDIDYRAKAGQHRGVSYSRQVTKTAMQGGPTIEQTSFVGVLGSKEAIMVIGDAAAMHAAIDHLHAKERLELPAALRPSIELANNRGASALFVMDFGAMLGHLAQPVPLMAMSFNFHGAVMEMTMDFFAASPK